MEGSGDAETVAVDTNNDVGGDQEGHVQTNANSTSSSSSGTVMDFCDLLKLMSDTGEQEMKEREELRKTDKEKTREERLTNDRRTNKLMDMVREGRQNPHVAMDIKLTLLGGKDDNIEAYLVRFDRAMEALKVDCVFSPCAVSNREGTTSRCMYE